MRQQFKSLLMVLAMVIGALFHSQVCAFDHITGEMLTPTFLFAMLFITFCCVDIRDLKLSLPHLWLILFQVIIGIGIYYLALPLGEIVAQGLMICVVIPVAMAAVVMGGMLGANINRIATYSVVSNMIMSIVIPIFFTRIGGEGCSFSMILTRVAPLMIIPPVLAQLTKYIAPRITNWFAKRGQISYYLWVVSLVITVGRTSTFIVNNIANIEIVTAIILTFGSLVICLLQYKIGRIIGSAYGDASAGEQSLGQKNTILAIWMTQTFLSPISSIAPTSYVIWQNLMNTYRLYIYNRSKIRQG